MENVKFLSPERKTTVEVNITPPLSEYIRSTYTGNAVEDHQATLANANKLREDIRHSSDKSDKTRLLFLRYDAILASMETRFPLGDNAIKLEFTWTDSANPKKKRTEKSFFFERGCHLFNTAALLAQIGAIQNVSTIEGLKVAGASFLEAAGIWKFLKEEYLVSHPELVADDLSEDIEMHQAVVLAQAQECMYLSALKSNASPGVRAKLAMGISRLWSIASKFIHAQQKSRAPKNWDHHADIKEIVFRALAFYDAGQGSLAAKSYGIAVAYYREASMALEGAKKKLVGGGGLFGGGAPPPELKTAVEQHSIVIGTAFAALDRDNNTIYHESDPVLEKLPPIEGKTMVAPRLPAEMGAKRDDPFAMLVPFAIRQAQSVYDSQRDNLIRSLRQEMEETRQETVAFLSSLGLPAAIQVLDNPTSLPDVLRSRMQTIRSDNGPDQIRDLLTGKEGLAQEDLQILKDAQELLAKEAAEDSAMRSKYGARWNRQESHVVAQRYHAEYDSYKSKLDHAMKSDEIVRKKWEDHGPYIVQLAGSEQDLLASLPKSTSGQSNPHADKVRQLLSQLEVLLQQRNELEKDLQKMCVTDDISQRLLNDTNYESIYVEELRKYSPLQDRLRENLKKDVDLREPIRQSAVENAAKQQLDDSQKQRVEVLTKLELAAKAYVELKSHGKEGMQFYADFQDILVKFKQNCRDFMFARQTEKNDMIAKLESTPAAQLPPPQTAPLYQQSNTGFPTSQFQAASAPGQTAYQTASPSAYQPAPTPASSYPQAPQYQAPPQYQAQPPQPQYQAPSAQPPQYQTQPSQSPAHPSPPPQYQYQTYLAGGTYQAQYQPGHVPAGFPPPQMPSGFPVTFASSNFSQPNYNFGQPQQPQYPPPGTLGPPPPYK